jgi:hypothetical protein
MSTGAKAVKPSGNSATKHNNSAQFKPSVVQMAERAKENGNSQAEGEQVQLKTNFFGEPSFNQPNSTVQARLKMGSSGDKYEKEADAVADKVVGAADTKKVDTAPTPPVQTAKIQSGDLQKKEDNLPEEDIQKVDEGKENEIQKAVVGASGGDESIQSKPISQTITPIVQLKVESSLTSQKPSEVIQKVESDEEPVQKVEEEESIQKMESDEEPVQKVESDEPIQAKKTTEDSTSGNVESNLASSKGGGAKMDNETQSTMESGIGADFSNVRIHTDSKAENMNQNLGAKAFTNGSDVYFNKGQYNPSSKEGQHLIAHELTHTVQQGATSKSADPTETPIQAKLDQYEKPEHGKNTEKRLNSELDERKGEPSDEPPSKSDKKSDMNELDGPTKPRIDESAKQLPKTKEEKKKGEEKIENPEKLVEDKETEKPKEPKEKGPTVEQLIQQYSQEEIKAKARAKKVAKPKEPQEVEAPEAIDYKDADGKAIAPDQAGDTAYAESLAKISDLRMQGFTTQNQGADFKKKGFEMKEKVNSLSGRVSKAEKTVTEMEEAVKVRHEAVEKGQEGLRVAKEKQAKFQEQSPQYKTKVDETKSETDEVVSEGKSVKSENESAKPEEPEDRENSGEAGGQLSSVTNSTESIGDTLGTVQSDLDESIVRDTEAGQKNVETDEKLTDTSQKLTEADAHLAMLKETSITAKADIATHASEPDEMNTKADSMIVAGEEAVKDSFSLEKRLITTEQTFQKNLKAVKTEEQGQEQDQNAQASLIQRTPDGGDYADKDRTNITGAMNAGEWNPTNLIANALTGQRDEEIERVKQQRRDEISSITADSEIPVSQMTKMQKVGLGLSMLVGRFGDWASSISTVDVSLFAINMVNPITYILGAVGGIGLMIDGSINFVKDILAGDVFGAIKSAGTAAMGLALLAGSITALAMLISLAVTVSMFFGFGLALGPIVLPVMANIMAFCGPIAYYAGITAAALNFIAGIKSLVDLGSAESATELQGEVNDLQNDATSTLTSLLMILVGRAGKNVKPGGTGGGGGGGLPVGQGAVFLGEFGTSLSQRIAAFIGLKKPVLAGAEGFSPFVLEPMPSLKPVLSPATGTAPATLIPGGPVTPGVGTMAATVAEAGVATQMGTQTATETTEENDKPKKRYKWWASHRRLIYAQNSMNNGFGSQGHHVWPKNVGGPHLGQQLLDVANPIHQREMHGIQGPYQNIHTYLTNAIKGNTSFASVLGNDVITHQTKVGNRKLIAAMKAGTPQATLLKTFVKNSLIAYYDQYRADSSPVVPRSSYSTGINEAEKLI